MNVEVEVNLKLVKNDSIDGWYTIEKAEHGNRMTTVMDGPNSGFLWYSGRVCDADVEGSRGEMLAIAKAIVERKRVSFKRCAVDARPDPDDDFGSVVTFWSPRNSRMRGVVDVGEALELAEQIKHELEDVADSRPDGDGLCGAKR